MKNSIIVVASDPKTGKIALALRDDENDTAAVELDATQAEALAVALEELTQAADRGIGLTLVMNEDITPDGVNEALDTAAAHLMAQRGPLQ